MTSIMITYAHFLLDSEFKPNLTDKYFIKSIINQVNGQPCFKSRVNNTLRNTIFLNGKI